MSGRSAVLHRVSVFALQDAGSADLVTGLALARPETGRGVAVPDDAEPETPAVPAEEAARERAGAGTGGEEGGERGGCSACRCQFESREEQVEHYKLDWHRFNLKQRLAGAAIVSAEEFEERTGDISSISGSESDSESEPWDSEPDPSQPRDLQPRRTQLDGKTEEEEGGPARQSLRVLFTNRAQQTLSLHRCVLHRKQETAQDVDAVGRVLALDPRTKWAVLLAGGGHFAGAVFQGDTVLEHKTFHRYTVRAKRGTAQGLRDGQSRGNAPKSAGASLRRYNEAALARDVRELLERWAPLLREADGVFVRAASYSRALLFGACAPLLARDDARVRAVPFATRRATHAEVVRVHRELAAVLVYAKGTDVVEVASPGRRAWRRAGRPAETAGTTAQPAVPSHGGGTGDDADDDDDGDVTLQTSEECLSTAHLSEYDLQPSRAARRRAARNNNNKQKKQQQQQPQQQQQQQSDLSEGQEERHPKGSEESPVPAPEGRAADEAVDGADGSEDTGDVTAGDGVSHGSHEQEEEEEQGKRRPKRREKKSKASAGAALTNALHAGTARDETSLEARRTRATTGCGTSCTRRARWATRALCSASWDPCCLALLTPSLTSCHPPGGRPLCPRTPLQARRAPHLAACPTPPRARRREGGWRRGRPSQNAVRRRWRPCWPRRWGRPAGRCCTWRPPAGRGRPHGCSWKPGQTPPSGTGRAARRTARAPTRRHATSSGATPRSARASTTTPGPRSRARSPTRWRATVRSASGRSERRDASRTATSGRSGGARKPRTRRRDALPRSATARRGRWQRRSGWRSREQQRRPQQQRSATSGGAGSVGSPYRRRHPSSTLTSRFAPSLACSSTSALAPAPSLDVPLRAGTALRFTRVDETYSRTVAR
ncbi:tRNA endonuclease ANKZF1 isoform X2 [Petromyzon marinus]|uniref:Ankyrin repeat and zinc finger domain-containing protein 1 isoform X2 n=1 Tax=Petromyzon marinus TaxID=7757 RepID=A0AAJ7WXA7_PETMA|nr:ankyrin repeat and zinc finger domain-containing protein 1 isoform X2 [Petromyzon marinus]